MMKSATKTRWQKCAVCHRRFKLPARGRPPRYCGPACRQTAYIKRKANRPHPVELLNRDLAQAHVRDWLRQEIRIILKEAGLIVDPVLPPRGTGQRKPNLKLIEETDKVTE